MEVILSRLSRLPILLYLLFFPGFSFGQKTLWWEISSLTKSVHTRFGRYYPEKTDTTDDGNLVLVNKRGELVFGRSYNNIFNRCFCFEVYCTSMPKGLPKSPALVKAMQVQASRLTRELVQDAILQAQLLKTISLVKVLKKNGDGNYLLDCQSESPPGNDLSELYATVKILEPGVWLVTLFARYPV